VLVARNHQPSNLVRLLPEPVRLSPPAEDISRNEAWRERSLAREEAWTVLSHPNPEAIDPLYLFACQAEWEQHADASAAWEVISAARNPHADTCAHARSLLERSQQQVKEQYPEDVPEEQGHRRTSTAEAGMRTPYGLEFIESCMGCKMSRPEFFCRFSPAVLRSVDEASHHSVMPAGAVLFVEGQTPRGVFILCSGKVKLPLHQKKAKC